MLLSLNSCKASNQARPAYIVCWVVGSNQTKREIDPTASTDHNTTTMFSVSNADELRQRALQSQKGKGGNDPAADSKKSEEEEQLGEASGRGPATTQLLCLPHVGTLSCPVSKIIVDCAYKMSG